MGGVTGLVGVAECDRLLASSCLKEARMIFVELSSVVTAFLFFCAVLRAFVGF